MTYIFYVLLAFMIIAAIIAMEVKNLLSAVICVGAVGFGAALMFLFLRAPDIALTQIVVEVVTLIVLIRVCLGRDVSFVAGNRGFFGMVISIAIILLIFIVGIRVLEALPDFGTPVFSQVPEAASQTYVSEGLARTGAGNLVASVILDFRAYDTLGEATVLFTAIVGAVALLRKNSKKEKE